MDLDDFVTNYYSLSNKSNAMNNQRRMSTAIMTSMLQSVSTKYSLQDDAGHGGIVISQSEQNIELRGNVWRSLPVPSYAISMATRLKFKFQLNQEACGHAICLDFNDLEDTSKRCLLLAGTNTKIDQPYNPQNPMDLTSSKIYNLALGKPATQSSTSHFRLADAEKAVDGYIDPVWRESDIGANSVSRTLVEDATWWEVDLDGTFDITTIHVHRASGLQMDTATLTMQVYNGASWGNSIPLEAEGLVSTNHINAQGSKVKIQRSESGFLALADVLVMGTPVGASLTEFDIPIGKMLYEDVSFGYPVWDGLKEDLALNEDWSISSDWEVLTLEETHVITDVILRSRVFSSNEVDFTLSISTDDNENEIMVENINLIKSSTPNLVHFILPPNLIGNEIKIKAASYSFPLSMTVQVIGSSLSTDTLNVEEGTTPQINYISLVQDVRNSTSLNQIGNSTFEDITIFEGDETSSSTGILVRSLSIFDKTFF